MNCGQEREPLEAMEKEVDKEGGLRWEPRGTRKEWQKKCAESPAGLFPNVVASVLCALRAQMTLQGEGMCTRGCPTVDAIIYGTATASYTTWVYFWYCCYYNSGAAGEKASWIASSNLTRLQKSWKRGRRWRRRKNEKEVGKGEGEREEKDVIPRKKNFPNRDLLLFFRLPIVRHVLLLVKKLLTFGEKSELSSDSF